MTLGKATGYVNLSSKVSYTATTDLVVVFGAYNQGSDYLKFKINGVEYNQRYNPFVANLWMSEMYLLHAGDKVTTTMSILMIGNEYTIA